MPEAPGRSRLLTAEPRFDQRDRMQSWTAQPWTGFCSPARLCSLPPSPPGPLIGASTSNSRQRLSGLTSSSHTIVGCASWTSYASWSTTPRRVGSQPRDPWAPIAMRAVKPYMTPRGGFPASRGRSEKQRRSRWLPCGDSSSDLRFDSVGGTRSRSCTPPSRRASTRRSTLLTRSHPAGRPCSRPPGPLPRLRKDTSRSWRQPGNTCESAHHRLPVDNRALRNETTGEAMPEVPASAVNRGVLVSCHTSAALPVLPEL